MQRKYLKINRKQFSLLEGMVVKHSFDGYIIICRDSRENEVLSPVLDVFVPLNLLRQYLAIASKKPVSTTWWWWPDGAKQNNPNATCIWLSTIEYHEIFYL